MRTLEIKATHPWLIRRTFSDYTAEKVRTLCASPDDPHDATGRFDFARANAASDARASEPELRRQLNESRAVDVTAHAESPGLT